MPTKPSADPSRSTFRRCKCDVLLSARDTVLHCDYGDNCPRRHEHDEAKFRKLQEEAKR